MKKLSIALKVLIWILLLLLFSYNIFKYIDNQYSGSFEVFTYVFNCIGLNILIPIFVLFRISRYIPISKKKRELYIISWLVNIYIGSILWISEIRIYFYLGSIIVHLIIILIIILINTHLMYKGEIYFNFDKTNKTFLLLGNLFIHIVCLSVLLHIFKFNVFY